MEFGSIKNQVEPHCVFTRSETGPELRVAVLVAVKIEESTKPELLSISGPLDSRELRQGGTRRLIT